MDTTLTIKQEIDNLLSFLAWDIDPDPIYREIESKIKELGEEGNRFLLEKIKNDSKNLLSVLSLVGNLKITESINELKAICISNNNIDESLVAATSLAKMNNDFGYEEIYRLFTESNILPITWVDDIAQKIGTDRIQKMARVIKIRRSK